MDVRYNKISVNNAKQCTNKINKTTQKVCDYIFAFILKKISSYSPWLIIETLLGQS